MMEVWEQIKNLDWGNLLLAYGATVLKIVLILAVYKVITAAVHRIIDRYFSRRVEKLPPEAKKKAYTFNPLCKQIWRYGALVVTALIVLGQLGVELAPLLATAGVAGIAIGFGAQRLVRDVITGFFLLLEDQYAVGDFVTIGKYQGTVEEVGLRITKLRQDNGDLHIIPNGNIENVTNHSRGNPLAVVDVAVAYKEDVDRVIAVLEGLCREMKEKYAEIVEGPTVLGVVELGGSAAVVRLTARTQPMQHWFIEREIRREVTRRLHREGIGLP